MCEEYIGLEDLEISNSVVVNASVRALVSRCVRSIYSELTVYLIYNAFQNKKGLFHSPFFSYENEKSVVWPGFSTKSGVFLRKKTMFLFNITLFLMFVSFNATTFYNSRTELEKVDHTFREVDDINNKKQISEEFSSQTQCTNTCNINI